MRNGGYLCAQDRAPDDRNRLAGDHLIGPVEAHQPLSGEYEEVLLPLLKDQLVRLVAVHETHLFGALVDLRHPWVEGLLGDVRHLLNRFPPALLAIVDNFKTNCEDIGVTSA